MSRVTHSCRLPIKDYTGLPKLPPNASYFQVCFRKMRKLLLLNPKHILCKKLFRNKSAVWEERKRHATSRYSYVIHPLSTINAIVQVLFFVVWFYSILMSPLSNFDNNIEFVQYYAVFPFRLVLIALFFNIGYIQQKTNLIVIESHYIIWKYIRTYFFFDLMATELVYLSSSALYKRQLFLANASVHTVNAYFGTLYIVRILASFVRINTLLAFLAGTLDNLRLKKPVRVVVVYAVKTYMYVHIFAISLIVLPYFLHFEENQWPHESWIYQAGLDTSGEWYMVYAECLVVSVCLFFGISYRYQMTLFAEQFLSIAISFFGRLYTLYLLADVLTTFGVIGFSETRYERNLTSLLQYMSSNYLPGNLRKRMLKYYEFKFQRRYFNEGEILDILSQNLRTELFLFSARKLIQKVEIFKRLPATTLAAIVGSMSSETYSPKEVIIKLGAIVDQIFFISTGTVSVFNSDGIELCHLEDGEIFGTGCILFKEQVHVIVAVETTEVFNINKDEFLKFLQPFPEAMSRFHHSIKESYNYFKRLEEKYHIGKINVFAELRSGNILEKPMKKLVV